MTVMKAKTNGTGSETTPGSPVPSAALNDNQRTIAWLRRAHDEQLALCNELEAIADSLPSSVDRQKCLYAAKMLGPLVHDIHEYEEAVLFPWIESERGPQLRETIERLKFEHCEDECFAEELTDALLKLGMGDVVNMEAVGYMLRGFFEGMRRHIAFERDCLLTQLPPNATPQGRQ